MDLDELLAIARAFDREGVEYVVFGDAAVALHGWARPVEDVDVFVRPEPENVARIKLALRSLWSDPAIDEIDDADMIGDYPSFHYASPARGFQMNVVSRLGERFQYDALESEIYEVRGVPIRIATAATLSRINDALNQQFHLPEN